MSYKCLHCTKRFKSKSGLRRHNKSTHVLAEVAAPHEEPVADVQDADDLTTERDAIQHAQRPAAVLEGDDAFKAALKALAIKPADVMSYRVYPDKVVIIEGPTGWKRIWPRDAS